MSVEFTIQCLSCGTIYNDLQDLCPYCGTPQPDSTESSASFSEQVFIEPLPQAETPVEEWFEENGLVKPETIPSRKADYLHQPDEDDFSPAESQETNLYLSQQAYLPDTYLQGEPLALADGLHYYNDELDYEAAPDPYQEELYEEDYLPEPALPASAFYYDYGDQAAEAFEAESRPSRFTWRRILSGCLGLFLCIGLVYGSIGLLAVRSGLQERALIIQTASDEHYPTAPGQQLD
jgi:hypothetical protein